MTASGQLDARIRCGFPIPVKIMSVRGPALSGYQYYDIALELIERRVSAKKIHPSGIMSYSSTCHVPWKLSRTTPPDAWATATPHSQRSGSRAYRPR